MYRYRNVPFQSKRPRGPRGSKLSPKKTKKLTAAELRRAQRRRSILDEIANSQGFVGDAKKRKQAADDLYADPALLDREERALRVSKSEIFYSLSGRDIVNSGLECVLLNLFL
jgi:hypothetical protein